MSARVVVPAEISLEYYRSDDPDQGSTAMWLADPSFTDELRIGVYPDSEDSYGVPEEILSIGRLQVELQGTPRALEALGGYLIALARLEAPDPDLHDHFENVQYEPGGTIHLVVRRRGHGEIGPTQP